MDSPISTRPTTACTTARRTTCTSRRRATPPRAEATPTRRPCPNGARPPGATSIPTLATSRPSLQLTSRAARCTTHTVHVETPSLWCRHHRRRSSRGTRPLTFLRPRPMAGRRAAATRHMPSRGPMNSMSTSPPGHPHAAGADRRAAYEFIERRNAQMTAHRVR